VNSQIVLNAYNKLHGVSSGIKEEKGSQRNTRGAGPRSFNGRNSDFDGATADGNADRQSNSYRRNRIDCDGPVRSNSNQFYTQTNNVSEDNNFNFNDKISTKNSSSQHFNKQKSSSTIFDSGYREEKYEMYLQLCLKKSDQQYKA
jgi:hypothetical protein